jgi:DNA invertase Pin-like site-specific DNA recombinase
MRVALYCRISTDEDLQRYSLSNQEASFRRHAEERGWEISSVFVDRIGGSKDKRPPATP